MGTVKCRRRRRRRRRGSGKEISVEREGQSGVKSSFGEEENTQEEEEDEGKSGTSVITVFGIRS